MKRILLLIAMFIPSLASAQLYPVTECVSATPTVDTSAYVTGDLIGGKLTFSGALRSSTSAGYIASVMVYDKSVQAHDLDLVIFSEDPSATTFTDQAAFDIADADLSKIGSVVSLVSANRMAFADNGVKFSTVSHPIKGVPVSGALTTTLYGALISRGTPTFATASDITVKICVSQD